MDGAAHIIVAAELTASGADGRQLPGMLAAARQMAGDDPRRVLAVWTLASAPPSLRRMATLVST